MPSYSARRFILIHFENSLQGFVLVEWYHVKVFCLIELLIVFPFCSTGKILLLLVKVDIVSRFLVQYFWDFLASLNKIHWMKSDAVYVRKCYVVFSNFNLNCVFLQVVVGNTDPSSMFFSCLSKTFQRRTRKVNFVKKVFRHFFFIWINKTKFMETHRICLCIFWQAGPEHYMKTNMLSLTMASWNVSRLF